MEYKPIKTIVILNNTKKEITLGLGKKLGIFGLNFFGNHKWCTLHSFFMHYIGKKEKWCT